MKKLTIAALMLAPVIASAQSPAFTLKGKISGLNAPAKAFLTYRMDGKNVMDSVPVNNGIFQFTGNVASPVSARLILDHKGVGLGKLGRSADMLSLYVDNGTISVDAADSVKKAKISGSKINQEALAYNAFIGGPDKLMKAIDTEYGAASEEKRNDPEFKKSLQERYGKAAAEKKALQSKFIKENPSSYFSLVALTETAGSSIDVTKVEPVFKGLSDGLRKSAAGLAFAKQIEAARATSVGAMAPEFTQNDVNDKPVSLASFKGKYVLIDFWASWCGPCRAENPNVVSAFNQYKGKNFTVLGISLDNPGKKDAWLAAIEKDQLAWTQLSDLNGWNNAVAKQYGIRSIPQNLLIDPNGKIIAKNLRGEELHKSLKEILGAPSK
ncbi:peroxiredoxin [Pedobacter africanus]|uniref:Peroxiredoxin n=1 Tax=Pedobacter africanus TaxID=151894 RepID=A0ACC6KSE3_9SPHI|nr:redoxin domain-containing protein [Pedobacter africanus]MDR6782136.1 peroxiredoxin [Pedobacter africanus]